MNASNRVAHSRPGRHFDCGRALRLGSALAALFIVAGCEWFFVFPDRNVILTRPLIVSGPSEFAVSATGGRYVAGTFIAPSRGLDFDPGVSSDLQGVGSPVGGFLQHAYVTRFSPNGTYAWTRSFPVFREVAPTVGIAIGGGLTYVGTVENVGAFEDVGGTPQFCVRVLDALAGIDVGEKKLLPSLGSNKSVAALAISEDGATFFLAGYLIGAFGPNGITGAFIDAFRTSDGERLASFTVARLSSTIKEIAVRGNRLYALTEDASVSAFDANTGLPDASFGDSGRVTFGSPNGRAIGRALAFSEDASTLFAAGSFDGTGLGLGGSGTINATVTGIDTNDYDCFIIALDAQTGQPRAGFGLDTTGDGQGDGVAVFTDERLNDCRGLAAMGDGAAGSLFLLANSARQVRGGFLHGEPDVFVARMRMDTAVLEPGFGTDAIQSFGGSRSDTGSGIGLSGDRVVIVGETNSRDAGVGGLGQIGAVELGTGFGFMLDLDVTTGEGLNAGPRIFRLEPDRASAGSAALSLMVHGTRFTDRSVVYWNDAPRTTIFIDGATLSAALSAEDLATSGLAHVSVFEPDDDEFDFNDVFSNQESFAIVGSGSAPVITRLIPNARPVGSRDFTVVVEGSNFEPGSQVVWDGQARPTGLVLPTVLPGLIPSGDFAFAASHIIRVMSPGGVLSNGLRFVVGPPDLDELSPSSATAGSADFNLTVRGTGFAEPVTVLWNGQPRVTTFINDQLLLAAIPASDIADVGEALVTVRNMDSGTSLTPLTFRITLPGFTPVIQGLAPASALFPTNPFSLIVTGQSFLQGAIVRVNGVPRTTTRVGPGRLDALIPSSDVSDNSVAGGFEVQVVNVGGEVSAPAHFVIGDPLIQELQPPSAAAGGPGFTLTVNGERFALDAQVLWDGQARDTVYFSQTKVTALISAADIAQAGFASVGVRQTAAFGILTGAAGVDFTIDPSPAPEPLAAPPQRRLITRDRDGDGFIDDLERVLGSSPRSAASTPRGMRTAPKINAIESLAPRVKTHRVARGKLVVSGTLPIPAGPTRRAEPVYVFAGGRLRAFDLNAHGASPRSRHETFRLTLPRRELDEPRDVPFVLRLDDAAARNDVFLHFGETLYRLPGHR